MRMLLLLIALFAAGFSVPVRAHVTVPAVLLLVDLGEGQYHVTWELRPSNEFGKTLEPIFPDHCTYDQRMLDCGIRGLEGTLGFEGIGAGQSAAMFKIRAPDGRMTVHVLTPAQPFTTVLPSFGDGGWTGTARFVAAYLQIGVEHILLGVDHLLFVLGLIWIARGPWMLTKTITAFTLAHTVSLAAATFGWVGVPETFVNAMIALSIVFVGVEMRYAQQGRSTWTQRFPWALAFFFGLLHGLGFAHGLNALDLPDSAVPIALLAFNLGVEFGQIAFVLLVLALAWSYRVMRVTWPGWSRPAPAYAIGGLAAFWFIERTVILLGA